MGARVQSMGLVIFCHPAEFMGHGLDHPCRREYLTVISDALF
jgi:hypothetical protein